MSLEEKDTATRIAIVGHMSVGKTTLFNKICQQNSVVAQGPKTHITMLECDIPGRNIEIVDVVGTGSLLFTQNEDEMLSRNILLSFEGPKRTDKAIVVADAKRLKRTISLALQCAEFDLPILFVLNMVDELDARGIEISYEKLSNLLGVDVVASVAVTGRGVNRIKKNLDFTKKVRDLVKLPTAVDHYCLQSAELFAKSSVPVSRGLFLLLLLEDKSAECFIVRTFGRGMLERVKELSLEYRRQETAPIELMLGNIYNDAAERIVKEVQIVNVPSRGKLVDRLNEWCLNPLTGIPIALILVYFMYQFVGVLGATFLVDFLDVYLFEGFLLPWCHKLLEPVGVPFLKEALLDENFGILPTGLFLAFGLVAPVLFCFYVFFGALEDVGYIPRFSLLMDKVFKKIGLNGKGVLPLIMGFSCVTMAILTTRMLETRRERNIAVFLLMLGLPCAPLLGVMFVLLGKMPISATVTVFGIIFLQIFLVGLLLNKVLPGKNNPLIIELPAMRSPRPFRLFKNSVDRTYYFLKEATPIFILASFIVFIFHKLGGLEITEEFMRPLTSGIMGLPEKSVQVFIKTMIRRESGIAELEHISSYYTNLQIVVNVLVMTFLTPCINAFLVIIKELGLKTALTMVSVTIVYSIAVGSFVNHICMLFGITF